MKVRQHPDPYGTDEQFDAYIRADRLKALAVFVGILLICLLNWWLP